MVKFDGINSTYYNTSNSPLPNIRVDGLYIGASGSKWIGTVFSSEWPWSSGLTKIDGTNWILITESGIPGLINDLTIDSSENVWIGTTAGLTKFDGTSFSHYNVQDWGFAIEGINAMGIDNSGNLWIAGSSLGKFDGVNWSFDHSHSAADLAFDKNDNLWTTSGGMYYGILRKFDGTNWIEYPIPGYPDYGSRYLAIDSIGNVWITTYGKGLAKFNGSNWTFYNSSNSGIPSNYLDHITIDQTGNIWLGVGGVTKFDGTNWTNYFSSNSGLPDNHINGISTDQNGNKWIATANGLAIFNEGGVVSVEENKNIFISEGFLISQNYPNPFNPSTKINYQLPVAGNVTLKVYDVLGNEIATLVNEEKPAGSFEIEFKANYLPSGVYFYQLKAGDYVETKKMILLK